MQEAQFQISLFNNKNSTRPHVISLSWQAFCQKIISPLVRENKDGSLFSPALFQPAYRLKKNVLSITLLVLDYDHCADMERDFKVWCDMGLCCLLYTSHSHKRNTQCNPYAEPRFRIVVLLAEPIPANYFNSLWRWAAIQSGGIIDETTKDSSRMFYLPAIHSTKAPYEYRISDGKPLDWHSLDLSPEPAKPIQKARTNKESEGILSDALTIDDENIIKTTREKFGAKFERLFSGSAIDYPDPKSGLPDDSRADIGFGIMLCVLGAEDEQVERIWKASGRNREKLYSHKTYVQMTIDSAREWIANQQELIDISSLEEIEDYDSPISNDPKRERYLRQIPRNKALLSDTNAIFLRLLGFEEKSHTRILTAITQMGGSRTCKFRSTTEQLQKKYAGIGKAASLNTVKRDKERLLKEQWRLDVALIGYRSFPYNPEANNCPPSEYQNHLLRKSLEAINIVLDENPQNKFIDRTKLEDACKRLLGEFPKPAPKIPKKKAHSNFKKSELEKAVVQFNKALDGLLEQTDRQGWDAQNTENWLQDVLHERINYKRKTPANIAQNEPYSADRNSDRLGRMR
jgi:hypothetical protein